MPVINYLINEDYIAEYFCINKDKPEMHCNGKCYLAMQLKKQQEQKKQGIPSIQIKEYPIGFVTILTIETSEIIAEKQFHFNYINDYSKETFTTIFHPPAILG
ncbi:hypothetical protein ACG2LH_01460 [Zhouia sp. PK063]|uniref:hypothetical protein n=1 Tax=Zhouia sp. PK063 TaxID=3373602 RepID=UPI0037938633